MNKLSLFSGVGGDDLASDWAGIKTIAFVERDKYCQKVLAKHWPGIPIIEDVKDVTREKVMAYCQNTGTSGRQRVTPDDAGESIKRGNDRDGSGLNAECETLAYAQQPAGTSEIEGRQEHSGERRTVGTVNRTGCSIDRGLVDIVSGGFPCQPHSVAGKRKGAGDERNLWPEVRRILEEIKPRWFVGENVPGLFSSDNGDFFGGILSDLASLGYVVGWCCYGAVDVGALHRRDRVFIVGHRADQRGDLPSGFNPLPGVESMEMAEEYKRVCLSQYSAGQGVDASVYSRGDTQGAGSRSHQREQIGQSQGESSATPKIYGRSGE